MIPTQTTSMLPTISFILMVAGVLVFAIAIPSVRRAMHARVGSMKSYFYHESELATAPSPNPSQESQPTSARPSLLEQVEPAGWNYDIYKTRSEDTP